MKHAPIATLGALLVIGAAACARGEQTPAADTTPAATTPAPAPATALDNDADDRVEDALDADSTLRSFDLEVDEEDGRLKIEGKVRTADQKAAAERVATTTVPGAAIDNRIEVSADATTRTTEPGDADDRVEDAFKADSALREFDLDADDSRGGIAIKGKVKTDAQKAAAEALAKRTAPTATIDNRIRVEP